MASISQRTTPRTSQDLNHNSSQSQLPLLNGNGMVPNNNSSSNNKKKERKVHRRTCRDKCRVNLLDKPRCILRLILFAVVVACSLHVASRLHNSAIFNTSRNQRQLVFSTKSDRVLFQKLPPLDQSLKLKLPSTLASTTQEQQQQELVESINIRPRVMVAIWPSDYDDEEEEEEEPPSKDRKKKHKHKDEEKEKENPLRASTKNLDDNSIIPLRAAQLDPNLIRPLTDRSIYMTAEAVKAQMHLENSKDYDDEARDPWEDDTCKAQFEWQRKSFPNCNNLHEQALWEMRDPDRSPSSKVKFLANGYWRDVWMVRDADWEPLVLKTIRYEHEYVDRNYDRHRRDAVAMEHLTSSPNIVSIYGFCGNSGIFEFASGGSLEDAIWYSDEPEWNATEKLVVAYQVASGIADVHNSDVEGRAAIAHTDITTSQFVFVNKHGRFLLNDFNRCRFIRWNEKDKETCAFHVGNNPGTFRSPEEYRYDLETEKIDVYSMGNIFYALMEKVYPFEDLSKKKAQKKIMKGERSPLSAKFENSTDPFVQALIKAMRMCWIHDPKERASSRDVEQFLDSELNRLGVHGNQPQQKQKRRRR